MSNGATLQALSAGAAGAGQDNESALLAALGNERMRALGQMVGLLTRSAPHQSMTIGDVKAGLIAPLLLGQYMLAGNAVAAGGAVAPTTALIWARVATDVDQRLANLKSTRITLAPAEWNGGCIVWMTEAFGDLRLLPDMIARLRQSDWLDKTVRIVSRGSDGVVAVRTL